MMTKRFKKVKKILAVDFEFMEIAGERLHPVCLVAKELISGQTIRLWGEEMKFENSPYSLGEDTLFIAYYAPAEMKCHLALGWPMPENILDLYAEFRVETNGKTLPSGKGLLGALEYYGKQGISALEKDTMRQLILRGGVYSDEEKQSILDYCESDVTATEQLFHAMWPTLADHPRLGQALLRGRYAKALARIEWLGIPIDAFLLDKLRTHWSAIQNELIVRIDNNYGVYEGRTFKQSKFAEYLKIKGIPWPSLKTGRLALDDETFSEQCKTFPQLLPLKELRKSLGQLRLNDLAVGHDDRNRCMLSMFRSTTGRNQPSTSKFIFGLSAWLRGLIKPEPGFGLAYVDWSQQEFGIAAALSGDLDMQEAYLSGDPYLAFAKQAKAVPENATKTTHAREREQFKACVLAVQYGMQEDSLARRIRQPLIYARELLRMHKKTYRKFWDWSEGVLDYATTQMKLWTVFGWVLHVQKKANPRSLCNFPVQANGSEMLRLACCLATEAGIRIVAPVHDAVLIEAPLEELESATQLMQDFMRQASALVLNGFELRSDAKLIRYPDRYCDERGMVMWSEVMDLLDKITEKEPLDLAA